MNISWISHQITSTTTSDMTFEAVDSSAEDTVEVVSPDSGELAGDISASFATGDVDGGEHVGGLVGLNERTHINDSYATGTVSGDTGVGGLIGDNTGTVATSYWDDESTNQSESDGSDAETYGLSTSEMTGLNATEYMAGFEFPDDEGTWHVTEDYPALEWQDTDGFYELNITETNAPITEGDSLVVTTNVTNWGADGEQAVELLDFDETDVATEQVALDSGADTDVELSWSTDTSGTEPIAVDSEADRATETVTIDADTAGSSGGTSSSSDDDTVTVGDGDETIDVDVSTENGVSTSTIEVSVSGGSTISLNFEDASQNIDDDAVTTDIESTLEGLTIQTTDDADGSLSVTQGDDVTEVSTDGAEPIEESTENEVADYINVETDFDEVVDSATFEIDVSTDSDSDGEDITVYHYADGEWIDVETELVESDDDKHTVRASTDSFSTFVVGVDSAVEPETDDVDRPTEIDDETPGFGLLITVLTLLGVAVVLTSRRSLD